MPRHKLPQELKSKHGSVSNVIRISLNKSKEDELEEYYTNKAETYSELRKAQQKVIERQEKEEQVCISQKEEKYPTIS
ncbi:MAG TPA: hypothetical protein PKJ95_07665, partial [Atribacterota bacterium]|nr:hypothetical protein [Atribacterota bacterium]